MPVYYEVEEERRFERGEPDRQLIEVNGGKTRFKTYHRANQVLVDRIIDIYGYYGLRRENDFKVTVDGHGWRSSQFDFRFAVPADYPERFQVHAPRRGRVTERSIRVLQRPAAAGDLDSPLMDEMDVAKKDRPISRDVKVTIVGSSEEEEEDEDEDGKRDVNTDEKDPRGKKDEGKKGAESKKAQDGGIMKNSVVPIEVSSDEDEYGKGDKGSDESAEDGKVGKKKRRQEEELDDLGGGDKEKGKSRPDSSSEGRGSGAALEDDYSDTELEDFITELEQLQKKFGRNGRFGAKQLRRFGLAVPETWVSNIEDVLVEAEISLELRRK
ncbi:hypothetical protein BJ508DRAFT_330395 [Ascobolus immersus RN42]|uniref:Uncharacterized protein n=1 Tax=Ascobolus immersus RN42 TaxID=1160509 RepID=A0A3N4HV99_ASCIM|nr:hypothetical protein BJ508DRAFT_330395 [Ascobolus immersus RN42]